MLAYDELAVATISILRKKLKSFTNPLALLVGWGCKSVLVNACIAIKKDIIPILRTLVSFKGVRQP